MRIAIVGPVSPAGQCPFVPLVARQQLNQPSSRPPTATADLRNTVDVKVAEKRPMQVGHGFIVFNILDLPELHAF